MTRRKEIIFSVLQGIVLLPKIV